MTDWGNVAEWVLAVTAAPAAVFVAFQFADRAKAERATLTQLTLAREAQEAQRDQLAVAAAARQDQVAVARANLLLRIDEQFEGDKLRGARAKWLALLERSEDQARREHPRATKAEWAVYANQLTSAHFDTLLDRCVAASHEEAAVQSAGAASDDYAALMSLPSWIETLGHLCRRNLLPLDDTLDLYDLVIIRVVGCIEPHLQRRRERGPVTSRRLYENASWIYDRAEHWRQRKDEAATSEPAAASTKWQS